MCPESTPALDLNRLRLLESSGVDSGRTDSGFWVSSYGFGVSSLRFESIQVKLQIWPDRPHNTLYNAKFDEFFESELRFFQKSMVFVLQLELTPFQFQLESVR